MPQTASERLVKRLSGGIKGPLGRVYVVVSAGHYFLAERQRGPEISCRATATGRGLSETVPMTDSSPFSPEPICSDRTGAFSALFLSITSSVEPLDHCISSAVESYRPEENFRYPHGPYHARIP